jgi:hypothetical protein
MLRFLKRLRSVPSARPQLPRRRIIITQQDARDRYRRNDTDGAARRIRQTVEDNRLR